MALTVLFRPIEVQRPNPKNTFALTKTDSFPVAVGNQRQLLAQGKHLKLERSSTPQEIHQGCEERDNYSFHTGNATCHQAEKSRKSTRTGFLVGTDENVVMAKLIRVGKNLTFYKSMS
jgi:hypothetical protein